MNKFIAMGRLTKAPETRYTSDKKEVASFSLAVDRRYKRDGQPEADFFNCAAFGKLAEFVEKYLNKGTKIVLEGEVQNNNYTDRNGVKHYSVQVIASSIEFAESKRSNNQPQEPQADDNGFMDTSGFQDDHIPFK